MERETHTTYRVVCRADWEASPRGCYGCGPRAGSRDEAADLALEQGWDLFQGRWVCPAHWESSEGFYGEGE